jgi:hypothetical protein
MSGDSLDEAVEVVLSAARAAVSTVRHYLLNHDLGTIERRSELRHAASNRIERLSDALGDLDAARVVERSPRCRAEYRPADRFEVLRCARLPGHQHDPSLQQHRATDGTEWP